MSSASTNSPGERVTPTTSWSLTLSKGALSGSKARNRSEQSLDRFYESLGSEKCNQIKLAVMDMWKAFDNSTRKHAPQAAILYDKFHVLRHLGEALDSVRKSEYRRVCGKEQKIIKGQKYNLLSRWKNLNLNGRQALKELLKANRRLNTAYVLNESFSQLWDYSSAGLGSQFFLTTGGNPSNGRD